MSRETFNLRNLGTDVGNYIQYSYNTFSSASLSLFTDTEFFLEAIATDYNEVEVSWQAPLFGLQQNILPVDVFIRWSLTGAPETVEEGFSLTDNDTDVGVINHTIENVSGRWVYYSMFLRYANNVPSLYFDQEQYFEKVASVRVLVPSDYGSINDLWERIPMYFRENDVNNNLYDYLKVFAWDIDYLRTLSDYLMVQSDPQVANDQTLQLLMEELGTLITTVELGTIRARQYIQDVINLRLQKGTEDGVIAALQAISGCRVSIDKIAKKIHVHPQRTNWIRDPRIIRGFQNGWHGAVTDSLNVKFSQDYVTFYGDSVTFTNASVAFNPVRSIINEGDTLARVYIFSRYLIPATPESVFYFSAVYPTDETIQNVYLYKSDATLAASAGVGTDNLIVTPDGTRYFKLDTTHLTQDTDVYLFIDMHLQPQQYVVLRNMLLEDRHMGKYFDGNTNIGGWLLGDVSRSDYRWHDSPSLGSDTSPTSEYFETYSVYSADAWRTRKVINNIYKKLLPVNWMDQYTVVFDELPAYPYDPADPATLPDFGTLVNLSLSVTSPSANTYTLSALNTDLGWPNIL